MIDFYKNKQINKVLNQYYNTFSLTLDTRDFVPDKYTNKIHKYIFKNMKKKFKEVDRDDRQHCKAMKIKNKSKIPKITFRSFIKNLFQKQKERSEVVNDKADYFCNAKIDENASSSAVDNITSV